MTLSFRPLTLSKSSVGFDAKDGRNRLEEHMDDIELAETAKDDLDRILGFFSRVDAKASVILAVDTGMLGFLTSRAPELSALSWWEAGIAIATLLLLGVSLWFLYRQAFPNLQGGQASLVYFREIADKTEAHFIEEFKNQSSLDHANDLLGQAWRNSVILTEKFDYLRKALICLALAIPPWAASLLVFAFKTAVTKTN